MYALLPSAAFSVHWHIIFSVHFLIDAGVAQLHNIIQVAITTSEDRWASQLLSQLLTVGGAYSSLIYDQPEKVSCEILATRCRGIWDAVDASPDLPVIVVSYMLPHVCMHMEDSCACVSICEQQY